ncbi:MAG TPA: hypothetical protein VIG42_05715 [Solirubrobacteraceae bacterium]
MSSARVTPLVLAGGLLAGLVLLLCAAASARAQQAPVSTARLDQYTAGVARAWEPYTTADGRVSDPLNPADTGDNYGVVMLADTMLEAAARDGDAALEETGERIIESALAQPLLSDPFNLLAIAATIRDGEDGELPAGVWERISAPLMRRAGEIGAPTEATCLIVPGCYDNWRLVWSAGAALLVADGVSGPPGSLAGSRAYVARQIREDLALAVTHAGPPLRELGASTTLVPARELSDPGAEPAAYELFSSFMLELVGEADPGAITAKVARLRRQADRYALDMMAPDGQLSLSGRSLDQSWVQAAAAALGARRARLDPSHAGAWRAFADRGLSYLLDSYPLEPDGLLPIVPGLGLRWDSSIVDVYAALNQYEGLTLWLLSDALAHWPHAEASQSALPADEPGPLFDDLRSSGLVWGRKANVWWELSGLAKGADPRSAQGLVAVKVANGGGWDDLLALRPREGGPSSAWTLSLAHGASATPIFTKVRGTGGEATLTGVYRRANGRLAGRATATLRTTGGGIELSVSVPAKTTLQTTVWLAGEGANAAGTRGGGAAGGGSPARVSARGATTTRGACVVTASGLACPVTIRWRKHGFATLEVGRGLP